MMNEVEHEMDIERQRAAAPGSPDRKAYELCMAAYRDQLKVQGISCLFESNDPSDLLYHMVEAAEGTPGEDRPEGWNGCLAAIASVFSGEEDFGWYGTKLADFFDGLVFLGQSWEEGRREPS